MYQVSTKLNMVKQTLRGFDHNFYSNITKNTSDAKALLVHLQNHLHSGGSNSRIQNDEKKARAAYVECCIAEEAFLKQK